MIDETEIVKTIERVSTLIEVIREDVARHDLALDDNKDDHVRMDSDITSLNNELGTLSNKLKEFSEIKTIQQKRRWDMIKMTVATLLGVGGGLLATFVRTGPPL